MMQHTEILGMKNFLGQEGVIIHPQATRYNAAYNSPSCMLALLRPALPAIIQPGHGNVGVSQPLLLLGNVDVVHQ